MEHDTRAHARRNAAAANRRELIAARVSRRDLMKMGLLTSAGFLVPKSGLSARASGGNPQSPPTRAFIEPLPIIPVKQPVAALTPAPTIEPNVAAGEGRTRSHQALARFPPAKLYEVHQKAALLSVRRRGRPPWMRGQSTTASALGTLVPPSTGSTARG